jgi:hypothetical protein
MMNYDDECRGYWTAWSQNGSGGSLLVPQFTLKRGIHATAVAIPQISVYYGQHRFIAVAIDMTMTDGSQLHATSNLLHRSDASALLALPPHMELGTTIIARADIFFNQLDLVEFDDGVIHDELKVPVGYGIVGFQCRCGDVIDSIRLLLRPYPGVSLADVAKLHLPPDYSHVNEYTETLREALAPHLPLDLIERVLGCLYVEDAKVKG